MNSYPLRRVAADYEIAGETSQGFDVLAAGLPCQAFARIGRSKLRAVVGDRDAFKKDPRAHLYERFLEYVRATRPLAVVMENVPDILNFGGRNVPEEICALLDELGYRSAYTLLNAAFYGVPQLRERLFLVALDRSLGADPSFPAPTHMIQLPTGYRGNRVGLLKYVPDRDSHFHPIPETSESVAPATSVRAALADLPVISEHLTASEEMRKRRVDFRIAYRTSDDLTDFAQRMRRWPGFETNGTVDGHVVRLTKRDFPIFQHLPQGSEYPAALEIAEELFEAKLEELERRPRPSSKLYQRLRRETVPPYDPGKFVNRWWKLDPSKPSRTLTAHLGKDTYTHIHYDGHQKRTISTREAARLQSFPDGFHFAGSMNSVFRQIGNAVPPLLALAVARELRATLNGARRSR